MPSNEIYQYSLISALMNGLASSSISIPISTVLTHGSFGVGTFSLMDGEMVVLDGIAYQFRGDGSARIALPDQLSPFAMVSHFSPQHHKTIKVDSKAGVNDELNSIVKDARNAFVLFKLTGRFEKIKIRTTYKQSYPNQPLVELTDKQIEREFEDVKGTIVGLRSPGWSVGVSVVGMHAHFIDEGRGIGGHILEMCSKEEVMLEVAVSTAFRLDLPAGGEFGERELVLDAAGIQKAEG